MWFALALVGQAVSLQLIDAGPRLHYQHYRPFSQAFVTTDALLLGCLVLQLVLVVAGMRSRWPIVSAWLGQTFQSWQLLVFGLMFLLPAATVSAHLPAYLGDLALAGLVQSVNLANVVLAVWTFPKEALGWFECRLGRLLGPSASEARPEPGSLDRFAVLATLWVIVVAAGLSAFVYERHPHLADEVGYLYHARYFAAGMLTMPAPPAPRAVNFDLMHYEADRWFSPVPPGWPALLALGTLVGTPWLVNPLFAGLNILLTYLLLRELYDRRASRLAVLLLCLSPWYVFMGMNFMTHTVTLTAALVAALAVSWARRTGQARWGWVGGLAIGVLSLIRPLEGVAMAGLLSLWAGGIGGRRLKPAAIAGLVLGTALVGGLVLPYNHQLSGDPTVFPIMAYFDKYYGKNSNAFGFGPERGVGWEIDPFPGHSLLDAAINANLNTFSVNVELFGWSTGSLLFIALPMLSGALRGSDYLMLSVIVAVVGLHTFYYFSGGPDFGARYWYLVVVPCSILTVRGIRALATRLGTGTPAHQRTGARVMLGVLTLSTLALVNYFPWRALDKYHHYLGMRPDIRDLAKDYSFGRSLVLIRGDRHPDYASAGIYNPLDLHADAPIYVWDRDPEVRAEALRAYADRLVWTVDGPSLGGGFLVVDGPRPASELIGELREQR